MPSRPARVNVAVIPAPTIASAANTSSTFETRAPRRDRAAARAQRKRDLEIHRRDRRIEQRAGRAQLAADDVEAGTKDRQRLHDRWHLRRLENRDDCDERGCRQHDTHDCARSLARVDDADRGDEQQRGHRHPPDEPERIPAISGRRNGGDRQDGEQHDARRHERNRSFEKAARTKTRRDGHQAEHQYSLDRRQREPAGTPINGRSNGAATTIARRANMITGITRAGCKRIATIRDGGRGRRSRVGTEVWARHERCIAPESRAETSP